MKKGKLITMLLVSLCLFFYSCEMGLEEIQAGKSSSGSSEKNFEELKQKQFDLSSEILSSSEVDIDILNQLKEVQGLISAQSSRSSVIISDSGVTYDFEEHIGEVYLEWTDCSTEPGFIRYEVYQKNLSTIENQYSGTDNFYNDTTIYETKLNMYNILKIMSEVNDEGDNVEVAYYLGSGIAAPNPANDPADGWDWTDELWFINRGLPNPYERNGQISSIDSYISGTSDCLNENGWELYTRRILNKDFGVTAGSSLDPEDISENNKYFCLYNRYLGIMKVFIYLRQTDMTATSITSRATITQGATNSSIVGAFINNPRISVTLDEKDNNILQDIKVATNVSENAWLIVNTDIAYDPEFYELPVEDREDVNIQYEVLRTTESDISLSGELDLTNYNTGSSGTSSVGISDLISIGSSAVSFATSLSGNMEDIGNYLSSNTNGYSGYVSLGNFILNNASCIGPIGAAASAVIKLINFTGSAATPPAKIGFIKGSINMGGTILQNSGSVTISIPYLGTDIESVYAIPYYFKTRPNERLGLFASRTKQEAAIKQVYNGHERKSIFTSHFDYYYYNYNLLTLTRPEYIINPDTNMVLENIEMGLCYDGNLGVISSLNHVTLYDNYFLTRIFVDPRGSKTYFGFSLEQLDADIYSNPSNVLRLIDNFNISHKSSNEVLQFFNDYYVDLYTSKVYSTFSNTENPNISLERIDTYEVDATTSY